MDILNHPRFNDEASHVLQTHVKNLFFNAYTQFVKQGKQPVDDVGLGLRIKLDKTNVIAEKSFKYATALKISVVLKIQPSELFPDKERWLFTVARKLYPNVPIPDLEDVVLELIHGDN